MQNQSTLNQPVQSPPVQNLPVQSPPVQSPPVQNLPVQSPPVQSLPIQSLPIQSLPIQSLPIQSLPIQNIPITISEEKPSVPIFSNADIVPAKLDDFQEPKVVMNEMASLMNKLEAQVARAAKKLTAKANEIEQHLTSSSQTLLEVVNQTDKDIEAGLVVHGDSVFKEFEVLFENLKTEIAEHAASARLAIKEEISGYQELIEEGDREHNRNLKDVYDKIQTSFNDLLLNREKKLIELVINEKAELNNRFGEINDSLSAIKTNLGKNLADEFADFKDQLNHETETRLNAMIEQTNTLSKELDFSRRHSLEKLSKTKSELETSLDHLVGLTTLALSRQMRRARIELFLPRLKERRQLVQTISDEMRQNFADRLLNQSQAQLDGLSSSFISASGQLKQLVEECMSKLDQVGRNQQAGLEEIFSKTATMLEQNTHNLLQILQDAGAEIAQDEIVCKKLCETYSLDTDPALTSLRDSVYSQVDAWKQQVKSELELAANGDCASLEEIIRSHHVRLDGKRGELAQRVRFSSDNGLQRIRAAIHDAYNAIQVEREKYME